MRKTVKKKAATKKKAVAKKSAVKKVPVKKAAAKKKVAKKRAAAKVTAPEKKIAAVKKSYTKSELINRLVEDSGVSKKDVAAVLAALGETIESHIKKRAVGQFTLPGLLKVKTVRKKATRARKGINPFSGEETMFKAKPARTVVKILPLKKMKEMVE